MAGWELVVWACVVGCVIVVDGVGLVGCVVLVVRLDVKVKYPQPSHR